MNNDDQEMARNCLGGSESAWKDLVRTHSHNIFIMSYRFTRRREEAEDLTQEVFVRACQTLRSYRGDSGSLSGWLMRVARNLIIDRYRRARREVRCEPIPETGIPVSDPRAPDPLQCLAREEISAVVHGALRRLSPVIREVVVLRDLEGLALHEVAAILHIPQGTVKSRLNRGHHELARTLRGLWEGRAVRMVNGHVHKSRPEIASPKSEEWCLT